MALIQVMTFSVALGDLGGKAPKQKPWWPLEKFIFLSLLKMEEKKKKKRKKIPLYWSCYTMSHLLPDGRWGSIPLCAAVIWRITSLCSNRRAASSSLSDVWVLSVSSREVGSDGKHHPSGLGSGILPVHYARIRTSYSVKSWSLKTQGWVDWLFWGRRAGVRIFSACRGCPFCTSPCLRIPPGCVTAGVTGPAGSRRLHGAARRRARSDRSLPGNSARCRRLVRLSRQASRETVLSFKVAFSFSSRLMSSSGGFGDWTAIDLAQKCRPPRLGRERGQGAGVWGASSSTCKMLLSPLSPKWGPGLPQLLIRGKHY